MKQIDKHSFKVPEGYFEGFSEKIKARLAEENLPKTEGFTVPDGYFEGLKGTITKKTTDNEPKVIPLNNNRKWYLIAASIAALFALVFYLNSSNTEVPTFDSLADTDIDAYIEETDWGLSSYEIAEVLPIDELEVTDILEQHLNEEYILEYLDENIETVEDLNFEYDE